MSKVKRQKRNWHVNFLNYTEFIARHPNYAGMPGAYKDDGSVRWVVTANSKLGKERMTWWDGKRQALGITKEKGCWVKVARKIHPTSEKPCQICGKMMKLDYVYPNKNGGHSPGAMSDVPDRFDGYHTYNLCCRKKEDRGRHTENMQRYNQDRRAYEAWSDGDWKAADWLMRVFSKHGVSADHIGPLSLGFCHRPRFRALTLKENIDKRNVMSYADVQRLLEDERAGEQVVSWHSKFLWNRLKQMVRNDTDAANVSKLMQHNLHYILMIFSKIKEAGFANFLIANFLHPEYAFYSIRFVDFNPKTGLYAKMVKTRGNIKQYRNNAARYVRIALDALDYYQTKENRRTGVLKNSKVDVHLAKLFDHLKQGQRRHAKKALYMALDVLAESLVREFKTR